MKKALIHDWFATYAGAEKCVESFVKIWQDIDIFSLVDFLEEKDRKVVLDSKPVTTSFIQNLPFARHKFRYYLPLFPYAIEQFDLKKYDIIISSSHAVAKGVLVNANQLHICYMHTPMRYAWDLYHDYLGGVNSSLLKLVIGFFLHRVRIWDIISTNRVDYLIANSRYIAKRIKKIYNRDAHVIYPPVDVDKFVLEQKKDDYYLTASRLVPYKKVDLIVEAFNRLNRKLVVVGDGPDLEKIKKIASKNIEVLGYQPDEVLIKLMQKAKCFVFAAEEDFGIIPVEAQACGTPVVCFSRGGTRETVIDAQTGVFFHEQSVDNIVSAVERFERLENSFNPLKVRENALRFSRQRFEEEIMNYINRCIVEFYG